MAGTVPQAPQSHTAHTPSFSAAAVETTAAAAPLSTEEEAFRRNTDCVYFLASPLTCKKGNDCEYRHSDTARMNPRDCWYWLHGNCLNPKCAFRHPPLDGLLGTPLPNPVGMTGPISQPALTPIAPVPAPYASGKQGVPCIFFQKGQCYKGDWCPFSHGPASANSNSMQSQAVVPGPEPAMPKKTFGLEKCTQEKKVPPSSMLNQLKPVDAIDQSKLTNKALSTAKQEFTSDKYFHHPSGSSDEFHGYNPVDTRGANDRSRTTLPVRVQPTLQVNSHASTLNGKDAEEVSREHSPGFDVLVDNEHEGSDYYHSEGQFASARGPEGMVDYMDSHTSRVDADRDLYRDSRAYDSYERPRAQYAKESRRSSERISGGQTHQDRRRYGRADSPDMVEHSDLRSRLSKPRRENGLRSVVNHDYARERPDGRRHQGLQRDLSHDRERQEPSLSSRLHGRIKVPGTSSTLIDNYDRHMDREIGRGRDQRRISPGRPLVSSRLRDRIKGLEPDGIYNDSRNSLSQRLGRDTLSDNIEGDFAAPKRLGELRSRKYDDGSDEQLMGKRKFVKYDNQLPSGDDLSFEGPKPLEEILKRKKRVEMADFEDNQMSHNTQSNFESKGVEGYELASSKSGSSLSPHKNEEYKPNNANDGVEVEEGMIVEGGADDQEPEAYYQGDEEVDYEHGDGDNFNLDDAETGDAEEEYLDEDDDDDEFAKKLGVMY